MKTIKSLLLIVLALLLLVSVAGCGTSKIDLSSAKGENWVQLDKASQTAAAEELIASEGDKAKDHTAKYYVRQLNVFFGNPGTSDKLVKDVFKDLAESGKTADELTEVDGYSWKKMTKEQKLEILEAEVKDISDKNPAFKPKKLEEYLREMDEIYQKEDERFLKQPATETIKKILTNNLIINGELIK